MVATPSPDLLLCCLPSIEGPSPEDPAPTKKLLTEIRRRNIPAKYWNYLREFPRPPFPVFVHGIAIWLTANDAAPDVYRAIRTWLDINAGGRVEVTLSNGRLRQVDISDMTEEEFLALF